MRRVVARWAPVLGAALLLAACRDRGGPGPGGSGDSGGAVDSGGLGDDDGGGTNDGGPDPEPGAGDPEPDAGAPDPEPEGEIDGGATPGPVADPEPEAPLEPCTSFLEGPQDGSCEVAAGSGTALLLEGTVVLPGGLLGAGQVLVDGGVVLCAGCGCDEAVQADGATRVSCPKAVISPGLVNAHDHITFTEATPVDPGDVRYDHRHEWRKGLAGKPEIPSYGNKHSLGDAWGEMRQALAGTTSLFGSGGEDGFLRNLDKGSQHEGLEHDDADYSTFPLGDQDGKMWASGCDGYEFEDPAKALAQIAYVPHVAEGVNAAARNEFTCVSGAGDGGVDYLEENAGFVHGIGLSTPDVALFAAEGTGLVWSPRSNTVLYGFTADAPLYDRLGARIALGTDWTATGSVDLLRELACARSWNETYWGGHFSDADLVRMATSGAAEVLGFGDVLGSLVPGKAADVTIWNASEREGWRAILEAGKEDVVLVLRGGVVLAGDDPLVLELTEPGDCEPLEVCGAAKRLCAARELGTTVSDLEAEMGGAYGLVHCGEPQEEPSCVPFRKGEFDGVPTEDDPDGDGLSGADDNCPSVFNPPRPVDGFSQPDTDGDDLGDACDPCPLDPFVTACSSVDPDDVDLDGVPNVSDVCPGVADPEQADQDSDGTGDACDACPASWNPGGLPCPGTIYDVKQGAVGAGEAILLPGGVVTAADESGFFLSVDPASPSWKGPEWSAVYVWFPAGPVPPAGSRVDVAGDVEDYFGEIEIAAGEVEVLATGVELPFAIAVDPADVVTGGSLAEALEAVLVEVSGVVVTDVSPSGSPGETVVGEFEVTGGLPVDDDLFAIEPAPGLGQGFAAIRGPLRFLWGRNKLLPRDDGDVQWAAPSLQGFGPALAVLYPGETGSQPALEVSLTGPAQGDTFVAVESADPLLVDVPGGGVTVPDGALSAPVPLLHVAAGGPVTLVASLGDVSLGAEVIALGPGVSPGLVSIDPAALEVPSTGAGAFVVTISLPAPAGGAEIEVVLEGGSPKVSLDVPPSVLVPPGATSAEVPFVAGPVAGTVVLGFTLGDTYLDATVKVLPLAVHGLLLAELLFNAEGADDEKEWVKLFNASPDPIDLSGYSLGYGGTAWTAGKKALSGVVAPWSCFVLGGPVSGADNGAPDYDLESEFDPPIQNGGDTADGVGLFDVPAAKLTTSSVPIDALLYGETNASKLKGPGGSADAEPHVPGTAPGESVRRLDLGTWTVGPPAPGSCILLQ